MQKKVKSNKFRHRRGFMKEAQEYAKEYREELQLEENEPLCPFHLAKHLDIPVHKLSTHPNIPDNAKEYLMNGGANEFSATTLVDGTYKEIIHNDAHHPNRQNSNVAHELAHIILGHEPRPPMAGDGCRNFDRRMENEAKDLGCILLVPKPAALLAVEGFHTKDDAAEYFKVSTSLLNYCIQRSDAHRWAMNRRKYFNSRRSTR